MYVMVNTTVNLHNVLKIRQTRQIQLPPDPGLSKRLRPKSDVGISDAGIFEKLEESSEVVDIKVLLLLLCQLHGRLSSFNG